MNRQLGIRRSALGCARDVALSFLKKGLQTIVFAPSRLSTEILVTYLKEALETRPGSEGVIRGYRGGYLPLKRREIERGLRDGSVLGRRLHQRPGAGHRHRQPRRGGAARLPGQRRLHLAAGGPRRAAARAPRWRCWWRTRRPLNQFIAKNPDYFFDAPSSRHASTPTTSTSWSTT